MDDDSEVATLVARAAARGGLPPATLEALLALEEQFQDFTIPGERTRFGRAVGEILDAAVPAKPDDSER